MPRKKKSGKRNTLICAIPGLRKPIEIGFESKKLPVCKKCKKIYKTRQLCRVRDEHTDLPWNTTFICFEVDDTCLVNGHFVQAKGDKFVAEILPETSIQAAPYFADLDKLGPDPPICRDCKDKNYTRYHCRTNHCHPKLPWGTFYAVLKRVDSEDAKTALISSDGVDFTDCGISVPTLESPNTERIFKDIGSGLDSLCQPLKRECSYSYEEETHSKRIKSGERRTKSLVETVMDVNESSKAFVLIIHEEETSLHWLKTNSSDTALQLNRSIDSHHESAPTQGHDSDYGKHNQSSYHDEHHSSTHDIMYNNNNTNNNTNNNININNQRYHPSHNIPPQNIYYAGHGKNEDASGIEPMPFISSTYPAKEYYNHNGNCYIRQPHNDRSAYPARGHANTSQHGYSPPNSYNYQTQLQYDYRQPPSPQQQMNTLAEYGYNGNGQDTRNSYHQHQYYGNNSHSRGYYENEDSPSYKDPPFPSRKIEYETGREVTEASSGSMQKFERRRNDQAKNETYLTSWTDSFMGKDDDITGRIQSINEMESLAAGDDDIIPL